MSTTDLSKLTISREHKAFSGNMKSRRKWWIAAIVLVILGGVMAMRGGGNTFNVENGIVANAYPSQAITALRDSIDRSPKNPLFHYHLGLAYMRSGDRSKAKTTLEEALRLSTNFPGAADARKQLSTL